MKYFTLWITDALCGSSHPFWLPCYCAKFSVFKFAMAFRLVRKSFADLISGYWLAHEASDLCPEVSITMQNNEKITISITN